MEKLKGKVAIITGATSGMGESHTRLFVKEGAKVVIIGRSDEEGKALEQELGKENTLYINHDVSNYEGWANVIEKTESVFGPINILVNNAGISLFQPLDEFNVEDYEKVIRINQNGVVYGTIAVQESMKKTKNGSIINISSMAGIGGQKGLLAYSASKFAVRGISKTSAIELAPFNIRVNTIMPGMTHTPLLGNIDGEAVKAIASTIPLLRIGQAEDISPIIVFLASDDSSFITGAEIAVDGGQLAKF